MDDTAQIIKTANALPTLKAKVDYLRPLVAHHYIALFADTYRAKRRKRNMSPHTIRSDNTFFGKHFLNPQVSNYDQVFKYCNEATYEYLGYMHKQAPIDGLQDLAAAYKDKKQNITTMVEELKWKKPLKVDINEILPKVNALTPDKLSIDQLLAIKLACLFCLSGDPGMLCQQPTGNCLYDQMSTVWVA
ncbi:hypothetical protein GGF31_002555 [Allomyces arbusculus]|nr:hypothetical protein GGF31_002555 [Allomyces arbusculus]